ncbi:RHS repeat-associated core domain-containing protein [Taibaiella koreensis]|uniref:RHS repeat-associated core domain-containing protein n=1 Tax=Taibaiella koreensis TaxID=1268548 RepID=UPI000E59CCE5|nr:RHS repeat-associated core domain-containing protein [Taibaiella koreensis]
MIKFEGSSLTDPVVERTTIHISDGSGRITMLETRTIGSAAEDNDTLAELSRYIYSNHLQSASLELDEASAIISYEEYHPYGTSAYQAKSSTIKATAKRYRYTGKERDEESGLYYHDARYYIPWLCRWSAVDPLESKYAGMSPYNYSFNNPVMFNDPSGMGPDDPPIVSSVDNTRVAARAMAPIYVDPNAPLPDISGFLSGKGSPEQPIPLDEVPIAANETRDGAAAYYGGRTKDEVLLKDVPGNLKMIEREKLDSYQDFDKGYMGEGKAGFYHVTRNEIAAQEYRLNEARGEAIRGGVFGAFGSTIGGTEGALKGAVVDGVVMSFAGVGTPYGKVTENSSGISETNFGVRIEQRPVETTSSKIETAIHRGPDQSGITVKNTTPQVGEAYQSNGAMISNGKVNINGRSVTSGNFDFVVTKEGNLILGIGHYNLSGGAETVQAVGTIRLFKGQITELTNNSGHYMPSIVEGENAINVFNRLGAATSGVRVRLYGADGTLQKSYRTQ